MKRLILFTIAILFSTLLFAQYTPTGIPVFNNINDLKKQIGVDSSLVYVAGGTDMADFRGSFYRYLASSNLSDDATFYNVVQPTGVTTGRWIRTNQTTITYPQGTLFRIGLLKIFIAPSVTNASGESTINLTTDNTTNGTSIFSSVLYNMSMSVSGATTANDVVTSTVKTTAASTNFKTTTHRYSRGTTVGILGAASLVNPATNTPVQFLIIGL